MKFRSRGPSTVHRRIRPFGSLAIDTRVPGLYRYRRMQAVGPPLATILRDAIVRVPPETKRTTALGVFAWIALIGLQAYDSAHTGGIPGLLEFLSAVSGSSGGMLFVFGNLLEASLSTGAGADPGRTESHRRLLIALPAVALIAASLLAVGMALMLVRAALGTPFVFAAIMAAIFAAVFLMSARSAVQASRLLYAHARAEADAAAAARAESSRAQLAALQARMNPHFLFNALNTIAALIPDDPRGAERATESLAHVLRRTLDRTAEHMGTVGEEVAYVRSCLDIEQQRFGDALRVEWHIDPTIESTPLPPLVLQPLVENSIRHGAGGKLDGIQVCIAATRSGTTLILTVDDNGPGIPPGHVEGTGLGNLRKRLASLYGASASVDIDRSSPGAHVRVRLPIT
jgi:signal transduction histidine kinase